MLRAASPGRSGLIAVLVAALVTAFVVGCDGPVPSGAPATSGASPATGTFVATGAPTDAPSSEPPETPGPTTGGTSLRTSVEVNSSIVDRPGVPPDMVDRYWWTIDGDAGQIGTTAQIGLPAGERILTVRDGLVVSARTSVNSRFAQADLIVRDVRTGALVRQIATNVGFPYAELVGRQVYWAGMEPSSNVAAERYVDGGVWWASIDDNLTPTIIVRPGRNVGFMGMGQREPLLLSPSGLTLASSLTGSLAGLTDVIDTSTRKVRQRLDQKVLALTDDTYVAQEGGPSDPPEGQGIRGLDLATGGTLWAFPDPAQVSRFSMASIAALGATFVVEYSWQTRSGQSRIASLDARTGVARTLLVQRLGQSTPIRYPAFSISTAEHVAIVPDLGSIGHLVQSDNATVSILDTATLAVTDNAFVIDPPWLCFPVSCQRD